MSVIPLPMCLNQYSCERISRGSGCYAPLPWMSMNARRPTLQPAAICLWTRTLVNVAIINLSYRAFSIWILRVRQACKRGAVSSVSFIILVGPITHRNLQHHVARDKVTRRRYCADGKVSVFGGLWTRKGRAGCIQDHV